MKKVPKCNIKVLKRPSHIYELKKNISVWIKKTKISHIKWKKLNHVTTPVLSASNKDDFRIGIFSLIISLIVTVTYLILTHEPTS